GQRQQQGGEQLQLVAVVVEQRGEPSPDPDVRLHPGVFGVLGVHVVALVVGDHLQRQLVMVAQEDAPLAERRDRRGVGGGLGAGGGGGAGERAGDSGASGGRGKPLAPAPPPVPDSPKYSTTSAGHWFASASSTRSGYSRSTSARTRLRYSWVSLRFSQLVPSR